METDQTSADTDSLDHPPQKTSMAKVMLRFSFVAFGAVALWIVTWFAIAGTVGLVTVALSLIIPSAVVVLFALLVIRQEQTWIWPVKQMTRTLPGIRRGALPIESLNDIDGGLKELAAQVRDLLRELRSQKTQLASIEAETSQRVANRTDALQRKLGSLLQQATRDSLTGLFNRRMLDQFLPQEIERCRKEKVDLAVLMMDVDYFKTLNDTLGHASGDELLRNIAQIIRSTIREHDAAFRCGGDEFVVVLPRCNETSARDIASRVDSLVLGLTKTFRIPRQPCLSIGIATIEQTRTIDAATLLDEADKRLYEIKSARKALSRAG